MIISNPVNHELSIQGKTQKQLAKKLGVAVNAMNMVIHGRNNSPRMQLRIAHALGKNVNELFPPIKKENPRTA